MSYLDLILLFFIFAPVQPQEWSNWGDWSACSRSCGGGTTYQERKCLRGQCVGKSKNINSCNIQDCLNAPEDFRAEQCAEFNSVPFDGKYYDWMPYYGGPFDAKCALNCMPKGEFFSKTLKEKVVDGTRCDKSTYDMCVDGVCEAAGCDLIVGSNAKEDKCRVCNGGGNNCKTIKDVYVLEKPKTIGYVEVMAIPAGATNILVIEDTGRNYLALKNASFSYILNGGLRIISSGEVKVPGMPVEYKRRTRGSKESIFILGPTRTVIYLSTIVLTSNDVSISYEYSVPKSQKFVDHTIKYSWKVGEYGECSKKCSGGQKTRRVFCVRNRDNAEMTKSMCNQTTKPEESTSCNNQPCSPRWFIDSWGPCSKTCGEGTQVRRVHCEHITKHGFQMINDNLCPRPKAITRRKCSDLKECPTWSLGEWSKCSKSCGGGTRQRSVTCVEISKNAIHNDDKCPTHNRPRGLEPCGETPCNVRWVIGEWGSCFPKCGKGMRTRSVYCASSIIQQRRYPDYMCNITGKPSTTMDCSNAAKCPPMWYGSSWSKCTARCGKGMQMRNVFCGVKRNEKMLLYILPNNDCNYLPPLKHMQECKVKPCHTQWIAPPWKECSCGGGKRTRDVKCYTDSEEDKTGKACDPKTKPPTEDFCNLVDCVPDKTTTSTKEPSVPLVTENKPQGPRLSTQPPPRPETTLNIPTQPATAEPRVSTRPPLTVTIPTRPAITDSVPSTSNPTGRPTRPPVIFTIPTRPVITPEIFTIPTRPVITSVRTEPGKTTKEASRTTILLPTNTIPNENNGSGGKSMPAEIVKGPTSAEVVVGSDVTMTCLATGNPKPVIFWLKGNLDVSIFGQRFQTLPNGSLKIRAVQQVDDGTYTCIATNGAIPRRSMPVRLTVTTPPYVSMTLGYTVKEGKEAIINCKVSGIPKPTVQWFRDGIELKPQNTNTAIVTSRKITIKKVHLNDHGIYTCKATNRHGERTAQMMLDVFADDKTRMEEMMNGNCKDNNALVNCAKVAVIKDYCAQNYYKMACCKTCRDLLKKGSLL